MPVEWIFDQTEHFATALGTYGFVVRGLIAVVFVCAVCGVLGSMVVGNRMAFFSDAMAHCAFAGVSLGYLTVLLAEFDRATATWLVPLVMVLIGVVVGVLMVYVRDRTGLAHDTVIGVFFAGAIGFGAMMYKVLSVKSNFDPEKFLFGSLVLVQSEDLLFLAGLLVVVFPLFAWRYNQLVFGSFNPTLARTRGLSLGFNNYLFIILLALVVNLSIKAVGALLINAMLVVPAAAAANLSRNLRQMFWLTVIFCLASGLIGFGIRNSVSLKVGKGDPVEFGPSGLIVVTSVALFFGTMVFGAVWNRFAPVLGLTPMPLGGRGHVHDASCSHDDRFGQCP